MVSVQEIFTMHSLFNQTLSAIVAGGLPLHVVENQDGYVIQARVPGVAKKDIQVDIRLPKIVTFQFHSSHFYLSYTIIHHYQHNF